MSVITRPEVALSATAPDREQHRFRRVAGLMPTAVSLLSTVAGGEPTAMTVNSAVTVSLRPFLLLTCINARSRLCGQLPVGQGFAVTVLSAGQERVARHFADPARSRGPDQFAAWPHRPAPISGSPIPAGGLAFFDCRVTATHRAGDHVVVIGEVAAFEGESATGAALLFHGGRYVTVAPSPGSC